MQIPTTFADRSNRVAHQNEGRFKNVGSRHPARGIGFQVGKHSPDRAVTRERLRKTKPDAHALLAGRVITKNRAAKSGDLTAYGGRLQPGPEVLAGDVLEDSRCCPAALPRRTA